jgi:hypothetical protein
VFKFVLFGKERKENKQSYLIAIQQWQTKPNNIIQKKNFFFINFISPSDFNLRKKIKGSFPIFVILGVDKVIF